MDSKRRSDLRRFYDILARVEQKVGGMRRLRECNADCEWPRRGVYFFSEKGESRSGSGSGFRVVRVGTHAVSNGSQTSLWNRLAQHKGSSKLAGNHRGSIFRKLIGQALAIRNANIVVATWGHGQSAGPEVRELEKNLEEMVSRHLGDMAFLWVPILDPPSRLSRRAYIERNSIALLSNISCCEIPIDPPSREWLGLQCPKEEVRLSGLWNSRHVSDMYEPAFLDELEKFAS